MSDTELIERAEMLDVPEFKREDEDGELVNDVAMDHTFKAMSASRKAQLSIPRTGSFNRQQVIDAFSDSFELIGGVTRLAAWAHHHPTEFFKLYGKLLPSQSQHDLGGKDGVLRIIHSIAPGALDTAPEHLSGGTTIEHEEELPTDGT